MAVSVIDRLIEIEHCPLITAATVDPFLEGGGMAILFFTGDPKQRPESNDVAVVLRELASVFPGELRIGIVDQAHEVALKARFGVLVVPTLVYLREGRFIGLIPRIQDWLAYVEKTRAFLAAPASA